MGFFSSLFGKGKPGSSANPIRETLFGDRPLDQWPVGGEETEAMPWGAFVSARAHLNAGNEAEAAAGWQNILGQPGLESRHYVQAWHFLRQHGYQPAPEVAKQVLGIVVEVGMPKGLDLLAAYPDHSARYYNFSGAGVVWEHPDESLDPIIDQLISESAKVVAMIGPWEKDRPAAPASGSIRMSFLTPSGLHFGQGPMALLSKDPIGGRVVQVATILMQALIAKSQAG